MTTRHPRVTANRLARAAVALCLLGASCPRAVPPVPPVIGKPRLPPAPEDALGPVEPAVVAGGQLEVSVLRHLRPAGFLLGRRSRRVALVDDPPSILPHETRDPSGDRTYGALTLGPGEGRSFGLAVDGMVTGELSLRVDHDRDGVLDGPLYRNQGTGRLAAAVHLPFAATDPRLAALGDYRLWIWLQGDRVLNWYGRTTLRGRAALAGEEYTLFAIDAASDGDLTDDGIWVDLDRDGRPTPPDEHFAVGEPIRIPTEDGGEVEIPFRVSVE